MGLSGNYGAICAFGTFRLSTGSHQPTDGLIHHRPVIDGEKSLDDELGDGYNLVTKPMARMDSRTL